MATMPFSQAALSVVEYQTAVLTKSGQDTSSVTKRATQFHEAHGTSIFLHLLFLLPPLTLVWSNAPTPTYVNQLVLQNNWPRAWPSFDVRRISIKASGLVWVVHLKLSAGSTNRAFYFRYHSLGICHGNHRYQSFFFFSTDCISCSISLKLICIRNSERFKIPLFINPWKGQKYYTRFRILWKWRCLWWKCWRLRLSSTSSNIS